MEYSLVRRSHISGDIPVKANIPVKNDIKENNQPNKWMIDRVRLQQYQNKKKL
jgi:hypothetical protein